MKAITTRRDHPQWDEIVRRYQDAQSENQISAELQVDRTIVRGIIEEAGILAEGGIALRQTRKGVQACELYRAGRPLDEIQRTIKLDFYRLRLALHEAGLRDYPDSERPPDQCPCGKLTGVPKQKNCSKACRDIYGGRRQPDPDSQVVFNCLNCGEEVIRYKSYGHGHNKYCSNECSAKHNRAVKHIVIENAVVLDSGFEAFFFGLCRLWKIPIDRADRAEAVPVNDSGWYCPDFKMPSLGLYVEVKGPEDADDPDRYAAWRATGRRLAVLRREELHTLRTRANDGVIMQQLRIWAGSGLLPQ
jgi:hypothetical protein